MKKYEAIIAEIYPNAEMLSDEILVQTVTPLQDNDMAVLKLTDELRSLLIAQRSLRAEAKKAMVKYFMRGFDTVILNQNQPALTWNDYRDEWRLVMADALGQLVWAEINKLLIDSSDFISVPPPNAEGLGMRINDKKEVWIIYLPSKGGSQ